MGRLQRSHTFAIFPAKKNKLAGKRAQKDYQLDQSQDIVTGNAHVSS